MQIKKMPTDAGVRCARNQQLARFSSAIFVAKKNVLKRVMMKVIEAQPSTTNLQSRRKRWKGNTRRARPENIQ
jgi:hypothetical protein